MMLNLRGMPDAMKRRVLEESLAHAERLRDIALEYDQLDHAQEHENTVQWVRQIIKDKGFDQQESGEA